MNKQNHFPTEDRFNNLYDDGDIPEIDLPQDSDEDYVEPLPEYTRPRKDGPGGD